MKRSTLSKSISASILMAAFLFTSAGAAFAWGPDSGKHHGQGMQGQGMHGNCSGAQYASRAEMMKSMLKLTDEQQGLMDDMHQAFMELKNKRCPDGWKPECMKNRERMRAMYLFRAEIAAENPDFPAVAEKIKSEYQGTDKAEFDTAVDARAAFLESLTPEQREILIKMGPHGRFGKGHGMYRQTGDQPANQSQDNS